MGHVSESLRADLYNLRSVRKVMRLFSISGTTHSRTMKPVELIEASFGYKQGKFEVPTVNTSEFITYFVRVC